MDILPPFTIFRNAVSKMDELKFSVVNIDIYVYGKYKFGANNMERCLKRYVKLCYPLNLNDKENTIHTLE